MVSTQNSGASLTGSAAPSPNAYTGPNIPSYYSLAQLLMTRNVPTSGGTQTGSVSGTFTIQIAQSGSAALYGVNAADFWSGVYTNGLNKIERIKAAEISGYSGI